MPVKMKKGLYHQLGYGWSKNKGSRLTAASGTAMRKAKTTAPHSKADTAKLKSFVNGFVFGISGRGLSSVLKELFSAV